MACLEVTVRHQHVERGVEGKEGLQEILLIPEPKAVDNPFAGILLRKEYVVDLYDNTRAAGAVAPPGTGTPRRHRFEGRETSR